MLRSAPRQLHGLSRTPLAALRRGYASVAGLSTLPRTGEQLHGFTFKRVKKVPEYELTALHLEHNKTGADYLHLARDDPNNVFTIGFKTNPPDDTGVPHILEHTTLCGSERYPVRDPFFKMLPRTLSNFMNAMTYPDHTIYPFATTNAQDFKNLLSVYMDATLHPLLKESDFTQEGWRLGPENPLAAQAEGDDAAKRIVFKGVVYNEMKGQMSDAAYLYYIRWMDYLYPAIHNSGGDPQKITDLTWDQLKKFHADHYHPSNSKIFTYGNMPIEEHLKEIGARLDSFDKISVDHDIKSPITIDESKTIKVAGPVDPLMPEDRQHKTSVTWLLNDTTDHVEDLAVKILSILLLDGYGTPLYQNLIEAGLGANFSANTGMHTAGKRRLFAVGLDAVKAEDVPNVTETIHATIRDCAQSGKINWERKVEGILHSIEIDLREKKAQFGMSMMQRLSPGWFNGIDPMDELAWQDTLNAFKERFAKGGYLEGLLQKYMIENPALTFTMEPSESFGAELAEEENRRLAEKISETKSKFSSEQEAQEYLEKRELELLEVQEKARHQDTSCLPTVHVKDIPRGLEKKPLRHTTIDDVHVQWREAPTNGLTYFRAVHLLRDLPMELREMIPLFCSAIMRLGTRDLSMEQLEELMRLKTGGVSVSYYAAPKPLDMDAYQEGLSFSGMALDRDMRDMYEILTKLVFETNFNGPEAEKKIRELLQSSASGAVNTIAETGHSFARTYAAASLTDLCALREQTQGLSQVKFTTELASRAATDSLSDVIEKLKDIQRIAITTGTHNLRVALTCGKESATSNQEELERFLRKLPQIDSLDFPERADRLTKYPRNAKSFFPLPYQVYYSARAVRTVPYADASGPSLEILAELLTHKHLHHEIREKGGAYGGGAYSQPLSGIFGMHSYRDPNPQNTLKIMEESGQWARDRTWTPQDLEEAKLSVFQKYDAPESVAQEGMTLFLSGISDEMRQTRRERLLDVTAEQVQSAADQFLVQRASESSIAVLGEKKDWVDSNNGWKFVDLGMAPEAPAQSGP